MDGMGCWGGGSNDQNLLILFRDWGERRKAFFFFTNIVSLLHVFASSDMVAGDDRSTSSFSIVAFPNGESDVRSFASTFRSERIFIICKPNQGRVSAVGVEGHIPFVFASPLFDDDDDDGITTAIGFFFIDKFNGSLYSILFIIYNAYYYSQESQ